MEIFSHGNLEMIEQKEDFFVTVPVTMMKLSPKNDTLQNNTFRDNKK